MRLSGESRHSEKFVRRFVQHSNEGKVQIASQVHKRLVSHDSHMIHIGQACHPSRWRSRLTNNDKTDRRVHDSMQRVYQYYSVLLDILIRDLRHFIGSLHSTDSLELMPLDRVSVVETVCLVFWQFGRSDVTHLKVSNKKKIYETMKTSSKSTGIYVAVNSSYNGFACP